MEREAERMEGGREESRSDRSKFLNWSNTKLGSEWPEALVSMSSSFLFFLALLVLALSVYFRVVCLLQIGIDAVLAGMVCCSMRRLFGQTPRGLFHFP